MQDDYHFQGRRKRLIAELQQRGGVSAAVLDVMAALPRHLFVPPDFVEWAYHDQPLPIACQQTISQPYTVALQSTLLDVRKRDKVLEIGTGSGYQAAVLHLLGGRVFTIERHAPLFRDTSALLQKLGLQAIRTYHKDGYLGLPEMAPFDRILVTAGAEETPQKLLNQLTVSGIMVIPVGSSHQQRLLKITRTAENDWQTEDFGDCSFVPFLPGTQ